MKSAHLFSSQLKNENTLMKSHTVIVVLGSFALQLVLMASLTCLAADGMGATRRAEDTESAGINRLGVENERVLR